MNTQTTRLLATALLTFGLATAALAQTPTPASPPAKPPAQTGGQGMMGGTGTAKGNNIMGGGMMGGGLMGGKGGGMMGGKGGGMMGMMSAMTRMANTCNRMMKNASNMKHHPGKMAPGKTKT